MKMNEVFLVMGLAGCLFFFMGAHSPTEVNIFSKILLSLGMGVLLIFLCRWLIFGFRILYASDVKFSAFLTILCLSVSIILNELYGHHWISFAAGVFSAMSGQFSFYVYDSIKSEREFRKEMREKYPDFFNKGEPK